MATFQILAAGSISLPSRLKMIKNDKGPDAAVQRTGSHLTATDFPIVPFHLSGKTKLPPSSVLKAMATTEKLLAPDYVTEDQMESGARCDHRAVGRNQR